MISNRVSKSFVNCHFDLEFLTNLSRSILSIPVPSSKCYSNTFTTLLTKTTAAQNEDTLSYLKVCGLYFQAVVFVRSVMVSVRRSRTGYSCCPSLYL